jgi:hypothetical protein
VLNDLFVSERPDTDGNAKREERTIRSTEELLEILSTVFQLHIPTGTLAIDRCEEAAGGCVRVCIGVYTWSHLRMRKR